MVFMVILCHVVLKTSHLSTSYPGSVRNQRDWRGLPTAGLHFNLIRSPCLEDNHSVRTSSPGPLVFGAPIGTRCPSSSARCHSEGIRRGCPKNLNFSLTSSLLFLCRLRVFPLPLRPLRSRRTLR